MKQLLLFVITFMVAITAVAQLEDPVKWNAAVKKINAATYEVHLTATISNGWHLYSQTTPKGGPLPTTIVFTKNPLLIFEGGIKEIGRMEQIFEPLFGVDVKQFSGKVEFIQTVRLKASAKTKISGSITFMVCNDKQCLPPAENKFSIAL